MWFSMGGNNVKRWLQNEKIKKRGGGGFSCETIAICNSDNFSVQNLKLFANC